jgi:HK97 family phage portal protein
MLAFLQQTLSRRQKTNMGSMSKLKDIRVSTARQRLSAPTAKSLPSPAYEVMIWKDWRGYNKWGKKRLIEQAYERNAAFYAACNIIAQTIADMPIFVRYRKDGKWHNTNEHPILNLFDRDMSREEFIERLVLYLLVTGESYANIVFSGKGKEKRPLGFIVLPSQFVTPIYGDQYRPISHYEFQYHKKIDIDPDEIIFISKPDLSNYFQGMSPGVPLAEIIDLNNAGITWNKNVALSGGVPPIIASAPPGTDEQEIREVKDKWIEQSGANNAHVLKVLSGDLELKDISTNPHDAEWHQAILSTMRMIFMAFGVSSSLMNDAANKTYNNVKDSHKALYTIGSLPIAHRIYKKISRDLRRYYKDNPVITVDESNIEALQEDKERQSKRLTELVDSGILSRNEARAELGKHLSNDEIADKLIISNTPTPVKNPEQPPQNE